ncbi:TFIIA-alpha and beta-like factor [Oncorhynchus masou masou]|uniref:TFIIA-alpha and beta-like factor n=1 Tax=Oncorhynchus masou masou TaxID=90313 RepID=UPI003182F4D2
MLSNSSHVPKLYLSIIDDVIESMREVFLDEGLEDRVLDDLRQLWESKIMQSKAVDGLALMKNTINSSNFVLQLPPNYGQTFSKPAASMVIPAGQHVQSFTNNGGTLATFSLPPGMTYPVQIPAGVTLQTASGQLYKVNVPVMVTQTPAGHRHLSQAQPRQGVPVVEWRDPSSASQQSATVVPSTVLKTMALPKTEPFSPQPMAPPRADPQTTEQRSLIPPVQPPNEKPLLPQPVVQPPVQENNLVQQPQVPSAQATFSGQTPVSFQPPAQLPSHPPESPFDSGDFNLDGIDFDSPQPLDMSLSSSSAHMPSLQVKMETTLSEGSGFMGQGSEFGAREMVKQEDHGGTVADMTTHLEGLPVDSTKLEMALLKDYNYNDALADIIQLDGPADSSSEEVEELEGGAMGENEFLGMMTGEALQALQEVDGSSDDGISSSSGDSVGMDEITVEEVRNGY